MILKNKLIAAILAASICFVAIHCFAWDKNVDGEDEDDPLKDDEEENEKDTTSYESSISGTLALSAFVGACVWSFLSNDSVDNQFNKMDNSLSDTTTGVSEYTVNNDELPNVFIEFK
jgi:hypothetical protein